MRIFGMIAIAALLVLGCGEKGGQTVQNPQSTEVKGEEVVEPVTRNKTAETETHGSAEKNEVDPAFTDYIYPGSELGGQFTMGNTVSLQYMSQDNFVMVVNYYKQKFPDTNVGSGTTVYFGKQLPDGSNLTVTLTNLESGTQIILKLDKKL